MIGGSIVASNISSHHLVGVMGTAYAPRLRHVVIEWGAILIGFNALLVDLPAVLSAQRLLHDARVPAEALRQRRRG